MTPTTAAAPPSYSAPAPFDVDAAVHECLGAILMGQPIPEQYRAPAPYLIGPVEVRERVERILSGR
jgi:hypothetical protein